MATEISLNCLILGSKNPFPVDIPPWRTVGHLKRAIKTEKDPHLNYLAADNLEIFKVNDPRTAYPPSLMYSDTLAA